jgi:hypothetical protein
MHPPTVRFALNQLRRKSWARLETSDKVPVDPQNWEKKKGDRLNKPGSRALASPFGTGIVVPARFVP